MPSSSANREAYTRYNGEVKIEFDPAKHWYWADGKRVVGVTTLIGILDKPQLIPWAVGMALDYVHEHRDMLDLDSDILWEQAQAEAERHKLETANIGSLIHDWVDRYAKGKNPDMPKDNNVIIGVNAFMDWVKENEVEFVESERIIYSKEHKYIGTADFIVVIGGKKYLGDLKTGNGLYPSVCLQTAGYMMADIEERSTEYQGRWALRVAKETEEEYMLRQQKKQESRVRRGLEPQNIKPFQVFEARYLGDNGETLDRDWSAFLKCKELYRWQAEASKQFRT